MGWSRIIERYDWSADNRAELTRGWIRQAASIAALAHAIGLDAPALENTVERWNQHCADGKDHDFGRSKMLVALGQQPFYAVELSPSMLNTQGGPGATRRGRSSARTARRYRGSTARGSSVPSTATCIRAPAISANAWRSAFAARAFENIHFINFVDQPRPGRPGPYCVSKRIIGHVAVGADGDRAAAGALPPDPIRVPTGIAHQLLEAVGNVAAQKFQPLRAGHQLVIALQTLMHVRAIQDHAGVLVPQGLSSVVVTHLLQGKWRTQHVLRELLPPGGVAHSHAVVPNTPSAASTWTCGLKVTRSPNVCTKRIIASRQPGLAAA